MNLDKILNDKLTKITPKKREYDPVTDAKRDYNRKNAMKCVRLIKTGDLDLTRRSHALMLYIADKHGYVDKKTLTILKEE